MHRSAAKTLKNQGAAEQAMPANAVAGPAPATGVVPLPQREGEGAKRRRGSQSSLTPAALMTGPQRLASARAMSKNCCGVPGWASMP